MHRQTLTRRLFLQAAPASVLAAGSNSFRHRGYLGWITDLASEPDSNAAWPSMRLDERLLEDYRRTLDLMKLLGFNEIIIWGLYVSRAWPVQVESAVSPERGRMVERLIESAHERGIRVFSGLGVYSWGFDDIIKARPNLHRGNPEAMCASEPESWKWMQRVVDFVFKRFPIDGVSMQSADLGRCNCDRCKTFSNAEYHALLNIRVAGHIRSRWRGKTVAVNSWGMQFDDPAALPALIKMGHAIDYLIDVHDTSRKRDPGYRKKLLSSLACDFGTLGGPQVEPPQHWDRERWFLPVLRRSGEHLRQLSEEGGRACEYFFHILKNPGDEISFWLTGRVLSEPATAWQKHLAGVVEQLYGTTAPGVRDGIAELFLRAEDAYFRHLPPSVCGTISLEPLVSGRPGPPIYLRRLSPEQRRAYASELAAIRSGFEKLLSALPRQEKVRSILRCLDNTGKDLAAA
jgi:hypothetical protein